jgi:hypothetical protein
VKEGKVNKECCVMQPGLEVAVDLFQSLVIDMLPRWDATEMDIKKSSGIIHVDPMVKETPVKS